MTPAEAQTLQDEANARGEWFMWFVWRAGAWFVATALRADRVGGVVVGQIEAGTLGELRAMLPAGLTRREPTAMMGADVVETWD